MRKICIIVEFPTMLGGEHSLLALLPTLQLKFDLHLLLPQGSEMVPQLCKLGITHKTYAFQPHSLENFSAEDRFQQRLGALKEYHKTEGFSLIHANSLSMGKFLARSQAFFDVPLTSHLRDIMKLNKRGIELLNSLDGCVAVSQATSSHYKLQGLNSVNVSTIYNGVDHTRFAPPPVKDEITEDEHRKYCVTAPPFLGITIGQICLRKGYETLIEAIGLLNSRNPTLNYNHLIIGSVYSQKQESETYYQTLLTRIKELNLTPRIKHIPHLKQSSIAAIMKYRNVLLVHPANEEPLGRVLLEAGASGLPVIATDVGGTREIITHEKSGLLVPPKSPEAMADAIEQMVNDEHNIAWEKYTSALHQHVRKNFSLENSASQLTEFWTNIIDK